MGKRRRMQNFSPDMQARCAYTHAFPLYIRLSADKSPFFFNGGLSNLLVLPKFPCEKRLCAFIACFKGPEPWGSILSDALVNCVLISHYLPPYRQDQCINGF